MSHEFTGMRGIIVYCVIVTLGYAWAIVQIFVSQPFDAFVLFIVTFTFQSYRNAILKAIKEQPDVTE